MAEDCRLHYTEQIRQDILNKYGVGKTSAQLIKANIILLPVGGIDNNQNKLQSIKNTNEWALRCKKDIDAKYHSKYYGSQIVIDNKSNPRGTLVKIEIKSNLIDDFEDRDKNKNNPNLAQLDNNKQINTNDTKFLKEQVNTLFKEYLQQNGIKIEFLDSLNQEYFNDPVAIYDSINKVIKINLNKANITTLPEELGHHISIALGLDNTLIKRALNLIGRLDYKVILGQEYVNLYKNDATLLKLEYLGKLISKRIVENKLPDELNNENGVKIWDTIKNILDAFIKLFKPNSNIQDELDKIVSELSNKILKGDKINDVGTLSTKMAQLDNKYGVLWDKYKQEINYYNKLLIKLKNSTKSLSKKLDDEIDPVKKSNIQSNLDYNKSKIKNIEDNLSELQETKNKQILINLANDTLNEIEVYIDKIRNGERLPSGENIANIIETLEKFENFTPSSGQAKKILDEIKPLVRKYTEDQAQSNLGRDISDEINKNEQDIFAGAKNFGSLTDIKNSIARTISFIVKEAQNIISTNNKKSYELVKEQVDKLTKWSKANGVKNMYDIFIQEHNGTTVLTKEFTPEFYKAISDTYKLPEREGINARKKIATFNENRLVGDRFVPIDKVKYTNKNYVKIQNTKELKEFYEFYKKQIENLSDRLPVNLNGNFIPNIAEKTIGDILKSDKKLTTKLKEGIGHIIDIYESDNNDFIIDNELVDKNTIKIKYVAKIGAEFKSKDLGTSLLKFMYFTNSYEQMDDVLPKVRLLQKQIAEKKNFIKDGRIKQTINGDESNVYKMVDAYIKMQVLGQMKNDEKYAPAIDFGLKYTSLLRIGLNPFNALTNVVIGNIGNFVEGAGGRFFNNTEYTKAVSLFTKYNAIDMSTKDESKKSKLHKLIMIFNPLMELEDYENLEKINIGSNEYRDKINSLMYSLQRVGEKQLQTSTMLAAMMHTKLKTKDDVEISMLDAFDENGKWQSDLMGYELTKESITKFSNKIHKINQMIHGRYSSKDAAILQQYALFRAAFQFKKWIPAAIESRLQSKRFDDALGVEIEGRYHSYTKGFNLLVSKLQGDIEKIEKYKFTETDIYNMRKNMMELTILLATIGMYVGLGWDDDKEKKKSGWYKFTMSQLDRVSGDLLQWYNPSQIIESGSGGLAILKTAKDLLNVIPNMQYIVGGDKSEYKKGRKKGENKFISSVVDVLPVIKPIKDLVRTWNDEPYEAPKRK